MRRIKATSAIARFLTLAFITCILSGQLIHQVQSDKCTLGNHKSRDGSIKWTLAGGHPCCGSDKRSWTLGGVNTLQDVGLQPSNHVTIPDFKNIQLECGSRITDQDPDVTPLKPVVINRTSISSTSSYLIFQDNSTFANNSDSLSSISTTSNESYYHISSLTSDPKSDATPSTDTTVSVCADKIGMENHDIPDSKITASSQDGWARAAHGRLNGNEFWAPLPNSGPYPWIQANIGYPTFVSGIVTQGDGGLGPPDWVTSLKVSTQEEDDDTLFNILNDNGTAKIFPANTDFSTSVTNLFPHPVYAQTVRITCWTSHTGMPRDCKMRFEILGCKM